jgi:hypothetical protein
MSTNSWLPPTWYGVLLQSQAELHASRSDMRASVDAEHNRLLQLVSEQAASLAEKERQLEVRAHGLRMQYCKLKNCT